MADVVAELTNIVNVSLGEKPIKYSVSTVGNIPSVLMGDEVKIYQILMNLLSNAVKYTEKGTINLVIGTHALFQKDIEYANLGIVIADEEHRFGVRQRVLIRNKGLDVNYLKMSATPIPRTLAISVYGDTDISVIKTMPINRKKVITEYVDPKDKPRVMEHMKKELSVGHQIYVVTPLIEESEALDTVNANEIYEKMTKYFKGSARVGLIHGKLKAEEKEILVDLIMNLLKMIFLRQIGHKE